MKTLREWTAKRAGGRITVHHADGKVANVDTISCRDGRIVATAADGEAFELQGLASAEAEDRAGDVAGEAYQVIGQLAAKLPENPEINRALDHFANGAKGTVLPFNLA